MPEQYLPPLEIRTGCSRRLAADPLSQVCRFTPPTIDKLGGAEVPRYTGLSWQV